MKDKSTSAGCLILIIAVLAVAVIAGLNIMSLR